MPTLTTTTSTVGHLTNGVALVERLDPPESMSVHVNHMQSYTVDVGLFPATPEERRRLIADDVFAGVSWERSTVASRTWVGGVHVTLFDPPEVQA